MRVLYNWPELRWFSELLVRGIWDALVLSEDRRCSTKSIAVLLRQQNCQKSFFRWYDFCNDKQKKRACHVFSCNIFQNPRNGSYLIHSWHAWLVFVEHSIWLQYQTKRKSIWEFMDVLQCSCFKRQYDQKWYRVFEMFQNLLQWQSIWYSKCAPCSKLISNFFEKVTPFLWQGVFKTRIDSRSGIESIQIKICVLKIAIEINFLGPTQTSFELKNS